LTVIAGSPKVYGPLGGNWAVIKANLNFLLAERRHPIYLSWGVIEKDDYEMARVTALFQTCYFQMVLPVLGLAIRDTMPTVLAEIETMEGGDLLSPHVSAIWS
jgi:hypothetical protein